MRASPAPASTGLSLTTWGPEIPDRRWLWSQRAVELIAARVGTPVDVVADQLLEHRASRRYVLTETLAQTRRATVFAAVDQLLAREVALKVLHEVEPDLSWALVVEAQAMTRFDHPHIVRVHELGVHEGWPHVVMQLCDGDLEAWAPGKPWRAVLERLVEAGRGLEAVHAAGLVHGDVKPENILLLDGVAKLGDFGLARAPGWSRRIGGTPGFIAPEVADGRRGFAGDVFAFACTAWTMLLGARPFGEPPPTADSSAATLVLVERAREGALVEPSTAGRVLAPLIQALRRALDPRPDARPTLAQLLDDLEDGRRIGPLRRWLRDTWTRRT